MKIKEVIKLSAKLLEEKDVLTLLSGDVPEENAQAIEDKETLLCCYDLIRDELACEYLPLKKRELFSDIKDEKIYFSTFENSPLRILGVYDEKGEKVPYRLINDYVCVKKQRAFVEYNYRLNPIKSEEEECVYASGIIGPYCLAFGIASQFCAQKGRFNESDYFQSKYLEGVRARVAKRGNLKIPARRWL